MSDDVIVTGRRINDEYPNPTTPPPDGTQTFPGGYPYPGGQVYSYLSDYTNGPYDYYRAEIEIAPDVELTALHKQAIAQLKAVLQKFRDLASTTDIENMRAVDADGKTVFTGQEIVDLVKNMDFLVTNDVYPSDGATAAHRNTGYAGQVNPYIEVNVDKLVAWMGSVDSNGNLQPYEPNKVNFIAHELGHLTTAGFTFGTQLNQNGMTPAEHLQNEQFAFSSGRAILEMAGLATSEFVPDQGYGSAFFVVP